CRRHCIAAVETPSMIARVLLISKLSTSALPFQSHFVFGHIFYVGHAPARRNHLRSGFEELPAFRSSAGRESECPTDVRFTPKSGHSLERQACPLCAKSRHCMRAISSTRRAD